MTDTLAFAYMGIHDKHGRLRGGSKQPYFPDAFELTYFLSEGPYSNRCTARKKADATSTRLIHAAATKQVFPYVEVVVAPRSKGSYRAGWRSFILHNVTLSRAPKEQNGDDVFILAAEEMFEKALHTWDGRTRLPPVD